MFGLAGGSNDVEIKVKVDADGAITTFDKLGNELKKVDAAASTASAGLEKSKLSLISVSDLAGFAATQMATFGVAAGLAISQLSKGSAIDDVRDSFARLTDQAGVAGDELINGFSAALDDTVSKTDLLKQANELLRGGLDPAQFNDMAKAARVFAEETGGSATEALEALSSQLLRGGTRFTDSIGLIIDNNKVLQEYADKNHRVVESLSELEKKEALRSATLELVKQHTKEFGDISRDAGDRIDKAFAAVTNIFDDLRVAIAGDAGVNGALEELITTLKSVDVQGLADGIASFTSESIVVLSDLIKVAKETAATVREVKAALSGEDKQFYSGLLRVASILPVVGSSFKALSTEYDLGIQIQNQLTTATNKTTKAINDVNEANKKAIQQGPPKALFLKNEKKFEEDAAYAARQRQKAVDEATKAGKKAADEAEKYQKDLIKSNDEYKESIRKLLGQDALPGVTSELSKVAQRFYEGAASADETTAAITRLLSTVGKSPEEIKQMQQALGEAFKVGEEGAKATKDAIADADKAAKDFSDNIQGALGSAFGEAISAAISGGDVREAIASAGAGLGSSLGSALGAASGDPFVAAFAGQVGGAIGGKISEAFANIGKGGKENANAAKWASYLLAPVTGGLSIALDRAFSDKLFGESQGTAMRKQIDSFFADAFDAERLLVVINGQLEQIKDLSLGGSTFGSNPQFFDGLTEGAIQAFTGVATGFSSLLGTGQETALGLAQAFSENVGGSLNNLQLLVKATGKSFEDLKAAVVEAFLDGELSIGAAQTALIGIAEVAQDGIPGALGATVEALDNVFAAGTTGGRALIDAFTDVAFEAKELGIKDFGALAQNIAASGKYSSEQLAQYFQEFRDAGINNVDQLASATTEQLIGIGANLEAQGFLQEAVTTAQGFVDQVNNLPDEKTLTFNIKTNFDGNTVEAQKQGYIPSLASNKGPGVNGQ